MTKSVFLTYCMILTIVFTQSYSYFHYKFSGIEQLRARVGHLERDLERASLRAQVAGYQLEEYRQQIATLMPEALRQKVDDTTSYRLRTLASVVVEPDRDRLHLERAASLFERGKREFRDARYDISNRTFRELIERFPNSVYVTESYFLLGEGQYQSKDYESCVATVEAMISLFPDSELTGFALLRLGKIFELQDRFEDAVEIYKTVLSTYQDHPLQAQARLSLKAVEL